MLLYHGENDSRIPVEESQTMHAAFTKLGKDSTLKVFEGQGHGWSDAANVKRLLEARYRFFERVVR